MIKKKSDNFNKISNGLSKILSQAKKSGHYNLNKDETGHVFSYLFELWEYSVELQTLFEKLSKTKDPDEMADILVDMRVILEMEIVGNYKETKDSFVKLINVLCKEVEDKKKYEHVKKRLP